MSTNAQGPVVALYGSKRQHNFTSQIQDFLAASARAQATVLMHAKLYHHLVELLGSLPPIVHPVNPGEHFDADIAVSLGGDGTFLRTVQWIGARRMPVVGINTGHLGYLAALSIDELPKLYDLIASDAFHTEPRNLLEVVSPVLPDAVGQYALNEVALCKEESASMIFANVYLDGHPLADYRCDGLIVATSTGSTAYNLSVGGPIIQPTVPVWVLSPVAAHSLSMRPIVVNASSRVSILPSGRSAHVRLALDGRSVLLDIGTEVVIESAPFELLLLRRDGHNFADTLRRKLHWGEQ
ncbi:MAG: NAD(+)/NADH kinase [Muribaculaceae bacterium]|nr:NAD(+)/NADH kinase [Muribaculaceae bacterium]